ncbi:MAG: zeta toxin family protein [Pseudomonas helleri]|uniref:zeta toxin family protein n=1 Tax=Pseudomonas helleri TaxID=1608996 RepID=UPI003F9D991E
MTSEEIAIEEVALEFVRVNRSSLARQVVDTHLFAPEESPIAVFMCGSPGAGKTEISKALVELFESAEADQRVLRIDPDDFRLLIPGYTGANSYLFQRAVTRVLEKVLDRVFEKSVSFILDGTMASFSVAKRNIDRALAHNRVVQVLYVGGGKN